MTNEEVATGKETDKQQTTNSEVTIEKSKDVAEKKSAKHAQVIQQVQLTIGTQEKWAATWEERRAKKKVMVGKLRVQFGERYNQTVSQRADQLKIDEIAYRKSRE